jgi:hypothetical protein
MQNDTDGGTGTPFVIWRIATFIRRFAWGVEKGHHVPVEPNPSTHLAMQLEAFPFACLKPVGEKLGLRPVSKRLQAEDHQRD